MTIFEISSLEFALLQNLQRKKPPKFGRKMPYLGIFGLKFKNKI